ncbi:MAG: glycosyltransferase [Verrucomicrobiota bacterium]
MFEKLPSLLRFKPSFYTGGLTRFYLPLLYDLIAGEKPKSIVTLGFGDGQAFFAFCQAAREQNIDCRCVAVRRGDGSETDDIAWSHGKIECQKLYNDFAELRPESTIELARRFAEGSVDLLLIDDSDSGTEIRRELLTWESKLKPEALVLFHGTQLERSDSPRAAWQEWIGDRASAELTDGVGLGIARHSSPRHDTNLFSDLFGKVGANGDLAQLYRFASEKLDVEARIGQATRDRAALRVQKALLRSVMATGAEAQRVMDDQSQIIKELEQKFAPLQRDRAKAQLVMDSQGEQLQNWAATNEKLRSERDKLKAQNKEQKRILNAAKKACRKGGKCFGGLIPQDGPKQRRPLGEKVVRELQRWPRNLRSLWAPAPPGSKQENQPVERLPDRYETWIATHEPDAAALEEQRRDSASWNNAPKISLLLPVFNTPAQFLEEMLSSVATQTYSNWELCLVDAGSKNQGTIDALARWKSREPRIIVESLGGNFGIAENTNRAFALSTGDVVACIDHDDLLAPFALYEMARALRDRPDGEIFYSDEDRLSPAGARHAPFFKPEWSPALLYSCMYLGHLTAYRRELVRELGGWRKEFDLSQDYDLALRATDQPRVIIHVPKVLYHWREHPASGSAGGKPEARATNLAALGEALHRRGLAADIIEYPAANRARLRISQWPKVSIIIPTDSAARGRRCVEHLPATTLYPDYEIVIVTNSALAKVLQLAAPAQAPVRFVAYDEPFNFSEKCNRGAEAATGARLIFYNDDVETEQREWIQNLIEPLENPEVGAVAPKLLYATGKIQHAGLVTGVRGLVGTAFHQQPEETTMHANLAQSMRDVSALSGACLAMRRDDFFRVGGWDAVNTPVAHSDLDLCFKIREAGMRCVYTPFTTLQHAGHESLGSQTAKLDQTYRRDKSWIYLLRRWAGYTAHDPYFTENMRDWLYADSPTPIRMSGRNQEVGDLSAGDLLFVAHDLSLSGAPMMLLHAATAAQEQGFFITVMSPEDGPLREKFEAAGIPVIIDPLVKLGHESFEKFARDFDCVVANTIFSAPVVHASHRAAVPVLWWLHETMVGEHFLREDPKLRSALPLADLVFVPSERAATIYRPFRDRPIECLRNAIPDLAPGHGKALHQTPGINAPPLEFLLLGTVEPRKGQDIFVAAISSLPAELQTAAKFHLVGRVNDPEFGAKVESLAQGVRNLSITGPVSHAEALAYMNRADVLVCSSRDEAMPVTMMEAMSLGKAVISSAVGGIPEVLQDGENGLLVRPESAKALAEAIRRLIEDRTLVRRLGEKARATYEKQFTMERFSRDFCDWVRQAMQLPTAASVGKS